MYDTGTLTFTNESPTFWKSSSKDRYARVFPRVPEIRATELAVPPTSERKSLDQFVDIHVKIFNILIYNFKNYS